MINSDKKISSPLLYVLFIAAVLIGFFINRFELEKSVNYALYAVLAAAILTIAADIFKKEREYVPVSAVKQSSRLKILSYAASIGFFADFVCKCVEIYKAADSGDYKELVYFIPICLICLFSILSSFDFITIGLHYSSESYDFKSIKIIHAAPLCWALTRILAVLSKVVKFSDDVDSVVKYLAMILALCFFYNFAVETDSEGPARKGLIFTSRAYGFIGIYCFINTLISVLSSRDFSDTDTVSFSVTVFLTSIFSLFFCKSIVSADTKTIPKAEE